MVFDLDFELEKYDFNIDHLDLHSKVFFLSMARTEEQLGFFDPNIKTIINYEFGSLLLKNKSLIHNLINQNCE